MTDTFGPLVSTAWLADQAGSGDVIVLDASRHLPAAGRDPRAEFEAGHIPGARFLDLATLTDASSEVPAALPRPEQVAQALAELGVDESARIVVYDDSAVKTSARAWFALTQAGVRDVAVLDGGLAKWREEGRTLEAGAGEYAATKPRALTNSTPKVASKSDMLANCESGVSQVLDARGEDRVFGSGIDPVHGGQNGRIPGALNLPFGKVFNEDGTFKSAPDLRTLFEEAGVDLSKPLVTTCGSGVTASVLLLAAHIAGKDDVRLYDGSWQEWEADPDTPKEQGPV
ncbi:3-mercaptopyruvate sulfurtransferase [Erythrobacter longus]|uniref:Sulfurtransferase n=1 Tax=Erythrobacter longus TaxID=1044 RepID=A0A074MEY9_ERYLO|nr:sulfurtransferase [Erythrobacter longus]KEO90428.1 3-mercaptopyruvate sulfurtransferase [Erythrobacter longus]